MLIAIILISVTSTLQQHGYLPPAELGARLATPTTRNIYYWVQTEEEREAASVRILHNRELQSSFGAAVYRRDNASARVKLYETLDAYGQTASFSRESLMKLPANALTMAGDYCLNAGDLDGAVIVADVLREKMPLEDSLLFIEFVRIKSSSTPVGQSEVAKGLLLAMNSHVRSDLTIILNAPPSASQSLARVCAARGLLAEFEGDLERAAYHYRRALELDPDCPLTRLSISRVLLDSGAFEQGKVYLRGLLTSEHAQIAWEARNLLDRVGG